MSKIEKVEHFHTKPKSQIRLEIATSLLQGKFVKAPDSGYDPGNFYRKEVKALVKAALDIAEELIDKNKEYDGEEDV